MNRIYQGWVTRVEIPDGAEPGIPRWKQLDDWPDALRDQHAKFQDAVNYYLLRSRRWPQH